MNPEDFSWMKDPRYHVPMPRPISRRVYATVVLCIAALTFGALLALAT